MDELKGVMRPVSDPTVHTQCKGTPMLIVNTLCQSHKHISELGSILDSEFSNLEEKKIWKTRK